MTQTDAIKKAQSTHNAVGAAERILAALSEAAGLPVVPS